MLNNRELQFVDFFILQEDLNNSMMDDWRSEVTANMCRAAMFDEFSELMNSMKWKWWKKETTEVNYWNIKVETIDILHFALSLNLLIHEKKEIDSLEATIGIYVDMKDGGSRPSMLQTFRDELDHNVFMRQSLNMIYANDAYSIDEFIIEMGLTTEEVSALYIAKNTLNRIRNQSGYKDGRYQKMVDGKEDNEYLEVIVSDFIGDSKKTLKDVKEAVVHQFT